MMAAQLQQASGAAPGDSSGDAPTQETGASPQNAEAMSIETPPLRNRAGESRSPYVRAHADTLVRWQLLDDEAVERAKKENKLIFMNIGFRACHYCHLTRQESFSNPSIADLLNESFIPIVVDREERPDIDAIYWNYILTVNSDAGWPINMFLTPELEPVFGGTYWPGPGSDGGIVDGGEVEEDRIDFLGILQKLKKSWVERETQCRTEAKETLLKLRKFAAEGTLGPRGLGRPARTTTGDSGNAAEGADSGKAVEVSNDLDLDLDELEKAYTQLAITFDPVHGGFGSAPKFPTPAKIAFLLRLAKFPPAVRHVVGDKEVAEATYMALYTLRKIRDGGLHDHLGAGFARLSATPDWSLPHFEKMTTDNALLLGLYLDAWLCAAGEQPSKDGEFAAVVLELADYITSPPICHENGGFATSEAADSYFKKGDQHMRKGAYYLWTRREFDTVLGGEAGESQIATSVAAAYWNVLEHGNVDRDNDPYDEFINQNVLHIVKDVAELSRQFGISVEEVKSILTTAKGKLAAHREKERVRPDTDMKIVAYINGIVIAALARTAAALKRSGVNSDRGGKYITAAQKAASFVKENMWDAEAKFLYRIYDGGKGETKGFAEDYAFMIDGLLELYEASGEESWLQWADELQKIQIDLFYDHPDNTSRPTTPMAHHAANGAFYCTVDGAPHTILRLKDGMDTTQPSTNGVAAYNLFRLGGILCDDSYNHLARETIHAFEVEMLQHPWLFPSLLSGVVTARLGGKSFLITGSDNNADTDTTTTMTKLFTRPRAGSRSIIQVSSAADSWLKTRNTALRDILNREQGQGVYVLDKGDLRKTTDADVREEQEED